MWVFDENSLAFLAVNQAAVQLYGYSREEFLSMTINDIGTWHHAKKDGTPLDVELAANRIDWLGIPARLVVVRDITERKWAEQALRQSEERLRQMAEAIEDAFYLSDADTNEIIYVNPASDRIWGISRRRLQSQPRAWLDAVHPDDRERVVRSLSLWKPEGERPEWNEEFRIVRPDGSVRWVWVRSFPIRDESGAIVRFAGVERDITERKRAEEMVRSLLSITRELGSTLDVVALLVSLVRETLKLLDAKGGFVGMKTPRGMVCEKYCTGSQVVDFAHCWAPGAGLPGWVEAHKAAYITNDAAQDPLFSAGLKRRFGVRSAICAPLTDTRGEVLGFIEIHDKNDSSGFDRSDEEKVTAVAHAASVAVQNALAYRRLKETTEALRLAGLKYRGIFENALEGIAQTTKEGKFLTANPALARMLGFDSPEELIAGVKDIGRQLYVEPDERREVLRALDRRGEIPGVELRARRKDGTPIWVLMNVRAVRDESGAILHYLSIVQDITARKSAEEALRDVSGRLLRSQNEERRRIARELHDSTAQNLAALAMNLGLIRKAGRSLSKTARGRLTESLGLAQQACREIRTLSYLLHPPELEDGDLWSAVRWYTEGFSNRSGIRVDLAIPKASRAGRLPEQVETTLFRVVQESLANIHRHSGSRRARIRFARGRLGVTMTVRDQGRGLRPAGTGAAPGPALMGVGIAGMRERIQQLGGRLEIDSSARGTAVKVTLPLPRGH